jgi:hypothetical protein
MTREEARTAILARLRLRGWVPLSKLSAWAREAGLGDAALGAALGSALALGAVERRWRYPEGGRTREAQYRVTPRRGGR